MQLSEVYKNAKEAFGGSCFVCPECNGVACRGKTPGCGAKGLGGGFTAAYNFLQSVEINMDNIYDGDSYDTTFEFLGDKFSAPLAVAPMAALKSHYSDAISENEYLKAISDGCAEANILPFYGDGVNIKFFTDPLKYIKEQNAVGVPTTKPWADDEIQQRVSEAKKAGVKAIAMDIDAAGLIHLAASGHPVYARGVERLSALIKEVELPFIIKGIMTANAAKKAKEAGAFGILVSNHGGRVLDSSGAPAKRLPEIRAAVGDDYLVLVDGAIRSGVSLFKVLALGASAALIGRPFVTAAYGGGSEGVALYANKIKSELIETMAMTGALKLSDITADKIRF